MPDMKRRIIYTTDDEWSWLRGEAKARDVTASSMLRAAILQLRGDRQALARIGVSSGEIEDGRGHRKWGDVKALKGAPLPDPIVAEGSLGALAAVQGVSRNIPEFRPAPKPVRKRR